MLRNGFCEDCQRANQHMVARKPEPWDNVGWTIFVIAVSAVIAYNQLAQALECWRIGGGFNMLMMIVYGLIGSVFTVGVTGVVCLGGWHVLQENVIGTTVYYSVDRSGVLHRHLDDARILNMVIHIQGRVGGIFRRSKVLMGSGWTGVATWNGGCMTIRRDDGFALTTKIPEALEFMWYNRLLQELLDDAREHRSCASSQRNNS